MQDKGKKGFSKKTKRILTVISFTALVAVFAALTVILWKPVSQLGEDPGAMKEWLSGTGIWAPVVFVLMTVVQVVVAIIPGEPFEIAAGFVFGPVWGTVLVLIGIAIGTLLIFAFVRRFGIKAAELFFSLEKINSLGFLKDAKKRNVLSFILMFIPGTPKDLLSYVVPLTKIKLWHWMLIAVFARIPSVLTSTVVGGALGEGEFLFAALAFGITAAVSLAGLIIYNVICKKKAKPSETEEALPGKENEK